MKSCLLKQLSKARRKLPQTLREVNITGQYLLSVKGEKFALKIGKNNKLVVFCSPTGYLVLSKSPDWYGDGTFHVAAKHYYQLYIIHAYFMNKMIPCAFILWQISRKLQLLHLRTSSHKLKQTKAAYFILRRLFTAIGCLWDCTLCLRVIEHKNRNLIIFYELKGNDEVHT